nr:YdaS family helix-turn-helix protein [Stutzerimonas nitrititolerans]
MNLLDFIKPLDKQGLVALAKRCETTPGQLKQVAYGNRRANAALAISLERETAGVIRCEETRPDIDWAYLRNSAGSGESAPASRRALQRRGERRAEDRRQTERRQSDRRS